MKTLCTNTMRMPARYGVISSAECAALTGGATSVTTKNTDFFNSFLGGVFEGFSISVTVTWKGLNLTKTDWWTKRFPLDKYKRLTGSVKDFAFSYTYQLS